MLLDDFDRWVGLQPDAIAICSGDRIVRYLQLQRMAQSIARTLANGGVRIGDRVALYLPKDIDAVAYVLGILYAGAAYIPIDPRAPAPRVGQILEAASPRALIGHRPYLDRLHAYDPGLLHEIEALFVDGSGLDRGVVLDPQAAAGGWPEHPRAKPDAPAYLLYTSGSTGIPKGVVISHHAAHCFVGWAQRTFDLTHRDRMTNFAPLSFDLSIFDLFGALSSGACVRLIAPELLLRPEQLVEELARWRTTTIYAVPSTITLLERDGHLANCVWPELRQILYAGEPFGMASLVAAMQAAPHAKFFNLFGPTETNVCTYHALARIPSREEREVAIGRGCDHLTVELLDEAANPVPPGQQGELCVAGPSVMSEYFGDPKATAAAFHDPGRFSDGQRRYRTGDCAVADELGQFWFRGRRDRLVKRRGYRVELGDVEAALLRYPSVREAAVVAVFDGSETRIRGFVVLSTEDRVTSLILRAHCGSLLPPYMVPDSVKILTELPRTLTGKVDLLLLQRKSDGS